MHADSDDSTSRRVITQAEADRCCATSERDDSAPSESSFVLAASLGFVVSPVPPVLPEAAIARAWNRTFAPLPPTHVPKHLLLSVLLV
jgi:hypothetical protein